MWTSSAAAWPRRCRLPLLLYNLPQFTTGFQPETVVRLIAECPNIVGIKDSSGALDYPARLERSGRGCLPHRRQR